MWFLLITVTVLSALYYSAKYARITTQGDTRIGDPAKLTDDGGSIPLTLALLNTVPSKFTRYGYSADISRYVIELFGIGRHLAMGNSSDSGPDVNSAPIQSSYRNEHLAIRNNALL